MRLINVHSMKLEEFLDNSALPPYAILSHAWDEEEVMFSEFEQLAKDGPGVAITLRKAGYTKITRLCNQARQDSLDYAWADTCCIDKSSSTELSEAINSMFGWYSRAVVCYVYLEDVDLRSFTSDSVTALEKCYWVSRGWTLQELIAPTHVRFYSTAWEELGNKGDMSKLLSSVTQIPEHILHEPEWLFEASVAKRMSWAAHRNTTRVEDMAYSLMGIFNVNMPLLYGEGNRAFRRLQEEIMKTTDDLSILAWGHTEGEIKVDRALASHPLDYACSHHVLPLCFKAGSPRSMTHSGLQIQLPLLPVRSNDNVSYPTVLALLNCGFEDDISSVSAITLTKSTIENTYVRLSGESFGLQKVKVEESLDAEVNTIYILQSEQEREVFRPRTFTCQLKSRGFDNLGLVVAGSKGIWLSWHAENQIMQIRVSQHVRRFAVVFCLDSAEYEMGFRLIMAYDMDSRDVGITLTNRPDDQPTVLWFDPSGENFEANFPRSTWPSDEHRSDLLLVGTRDGRSRELYVDASIDDEDTTSRSVWLVEIAGTWLA